MEEYLNIALSIELHHEEYAKLWLIASEYYPKVAKEHEHPLDKHGCILDYSLEVHGKLVFNENYDEDKYVSEAMSEKELEDWNSLSDKEKKAQLDMDLDLYQMERRYLKEN